MSLTTAGWLCSCALMYFRFRNADRHTVLRSLTVAVILASAAIVCVSIGGELFVFAYGATLSDFAGVPSMLALWISIFVFLWAGGVGIVLLFIRERWHRLTGQAASSESHNL